MIWLWVAFLAMVVVLLVLDLCVLHRRPHEVTIWEAVRLAGAWVGLALVFNVFVYFLYEYRLFGLIGEGEPSGRQAAALFLTGYLVEESLSIDNIFVISLIFSSFRVPPQYQHRVLFWGILGAVVLRGVMIVGGIALIERFAWILYLFGAFLLYAGVKMFRHRPDLRPQDNPLVKLARRVLRVTDDFHEAHFTARQNGRLALTPLALALVAVESADVVFAVDSIPAIFAITDIPFIVFTSNIFAVLGLRSMYFALSAVLTKLKYLRHSLAALLLVVGLKMLLKDVIHDLPGKTYIMLGLIVGILAAGVIASIVASRRQPPLADECLVHADKKP